jgi:hypothetical protein
VEDDKDLLGLHILNWIHIKPLNDMTLMAPSFNHQDLLDVQMSGFSGLTCFLRYILTVGSETPHIAGSLHLSD